MFKKLNKKGIALLISAVLILSVAVGTTIAYLVDTTGAVEDQFDPAEVICRVNLPDNEDKFGVGKENWSVTNLGDIHAYIRVAVIVNETNGTNLKWNGVINADALIQKDSDWNANWQKIGNYYYYKGTVAPGASVPFGKIIAANAKIQVLAEAIQSTPNEAVNSAWEVNYKEQNVWETMKN